jgi:peptidoglycan-associated lipoprotein
MALWLTRRLPAFDNVMMPSFHFRIIKMHIKFLSIAAAAVLLAACESTPETSSDASSAGASALGSGYGQGVGGVGVGAVGSAGAPATGPGSQQDLAQNVGDRVFFGYDQIDLSAEGRATLTRQAAWLRQYARVTVTIEGHADERGTREYNLALAERRAQSVRNYLVAQGIDGARIETISYGKERPAVAGSGDGAWAQNRRAVTIVN